MVSKSRLILPLSAGLAGVLVGVLCQQGAGHQSLAVGSKETAHDSRTKRVGEKAGPLKGDGPTTLFLREISSQTAEQCEQRVVELVQSKAGGLELEMEAIVRRWMSLESPEKVLARLKELELSWRDDWHRAVFRAWVALDEKGAMESADTRHYSMERAMYAIGNADPSVAQYLRNLSGVSRESELYRTALPWLAREHPDLAKAAAAELPDNLKKDGIAAIATGLAKQDPRGAVAWLKSLGLEGSPGPLDFVLVEWAKTDPQAAWEAKGAAPKGDTGYWIDNPFYWSDPRSPGHWLSLALNRDPFLNVEGLYRQLAEADIDWETKLGMRIAINSNGWYPADPEAAAREAEKLPPGKARDFLLNGICQTWAAHDEEKAKQFAAQHQLTAFGEGGASESPTAELRAAALADPEQTFSAMSDPASLDRNSTGFRQLCTLATEWAERDPEAASRWLIEQDLPTDYSGPGGGQASALFNNALGYYWAGSDPVGASDWVASLPDGPMKSRAWGAVHENAARYSPDLAFSMTATCLQGEGRMSLLNSDLQAVQKAAGQEAALGLLETSALSPQEKASLAEGLRNPSSK